MFKGADFKFASFFVIIAINIMIYNGSRKSMQVTTFERIYDVVKQIPYGKVATYGQVAALAGNKKWARVVGYALHANPDPEHIPCFRVVNRFGEVSKAFAFGGENRQIELLKAEGIVFVDGRVDMEKYQWNRVTLDMFKEK